jgi:DNA repair protein RadD
VFDLRDYQQEAVDSLFRYFEDGRGDAPLLVLPTASGKSVVQAAFVMEALMRFPDERVVLVTHVRELLEQNYDKLMRLWPEAPAGLYSAGLNSRQVRQITVAGIQSVYRKAALFGDVGIVIVDECHLVPRGDSGMYHTFFDGLREVNPHLCVIGMSATPFRLDSGNLHEGDDRLFDGIAYEVPVRRLVKEDYLCRLVSRIGKHKVDVSAVHTRGGDFVESELEAAMNTDENVEAAVDEFLGRCAERHRMIVFCCGVAHAHTVAASLRRRGVAVGTVTGDTPRHERDNILADFQAGLLRAVTNCNVLTTGFDCPSIDAVIMLRPTMSTGLYIQQAGRGMRIAQGKTDCLVLDYAGNIMRHGPVDDVSVGIQYKNGTPRYKECPQCYAPIPTGCRTCPECQYEYPPPEKRRVFLANSTASALNIMGTEREYDAERDEVVDMGYGMINTPVHYMSYQIHQSSPFKPRTLQVTYHCARRERFKEWVCFEHEEGTYPRRKAEQWWRLRSGVECPDTCEQAATMSPSLKRPLRITVDMSEKYARVTACQNFEEPEDVQADDIKDSDFMPTAPSVQIEDEAI